MPAANAHVAGNGAKRPSPGSAGRRCPRRGAAFHHNPRRSCRPAHRRRNSLPPTPPRPQAARGRSALEAGERIVGHSGHGGVGGLGDVVVAAPCGGGDLLGHAGADELVLRVEHEELEAREAAQRLGHGEHLLLERLLVLLGLLLLGALLRFVKPHARAQPHVGAPVGDADHHHVPRVPRLLRLHAQLHRVEEGVRKGRPAAAGHALQALLGHGDGPGGRQQHRGHLALEGDEGDLVAALVGGGEQVDGRALGGVHAVERHRARRVDDEDDEAPRLARHLLAPHVRVFNVHGLLLGGALPALALEGRGGAHGGVHGEARHLALGQHGLDVAAPVFGEDEVALA
mmetsp:Transcript_9694/g.28388  ORF Transcript_9694/g.28388 Transcript_9694/m.28388 type:complete len:343 (+) Transcript_9694:132-1160(+)